VRKGEESGGRDKNDLGFVLSCSFINSGRVWV
jgi:hypothetical protein